MCVQLILLLCINCNKNGRNAFHYFVIDHLAELFPNATKIQACRSHYESSFVIRKKTKKNCSMIF